MSTRQRAEVDVVLQVLLIFGMTQIPECCQYFVRAAPRIPCIVQGEGDLEKMIALAAHQDVCWRRRSSSAIAVQAEFSHAHCAQTERALLMLLEPLRIFQPPVAVEEACHRFVSDGFARHEARGEI